MMVCVELKTQKIMLSEKEFEIPTLAITFLTRIQRLVQENKNKIDSLTNALLKAVSVQF